MRRNRTLSPREQPVKIWSKPMIQPNTTVDLIISQVKNLSVEVYVFHVTKSGAFAYVGNFNHPQEQFRVRKEKLRFLHL
jgi:hypothetical protein